MKSINSELKKILESETTNLVRCWKMKLKNGDTIAFTNNDEDFIYENINYNHISANDLEDINANLDIKNDSFRIFNLISSELILENDILSGKYDGAKIDIFLIDVLNFEKGKISLMSGKISNIEYQDNIFIAEVKGLKDEIDKAIGEAYSPLCRAVFCDKKCQMNFNEFNFNGIIKSISDSKTFSTDDNIILSKEGGYFENGKIKFKTGGNKNYETEIKQFSNGVFVLSTELPHKLKINDEFIVMAGCDKKFETCCQKFNNAINFRGEPHLPGIELLLKVL